ARDEMSIPGDFHHLENGVWRTFVWGQSRDMLYERLVDWLISRYTEWKDVYMFFVTFLEMSLESLTKTSTVMGPKIYIFMSRDHDVLRKVILSHFFIKMLKCFRNQRTK